MKTFSNKIWEEYAYLYDIFTPKHQRELLEIVGSELENKIFDMGMGVGKLIPYYLDSKKVREYEGVEQEKNMLNLAQKKIPKSRKKEFKLHHMSYNDFENEKKFGKESTFVLLNTLYSNKNPMKILNKIDKNIVYGDKVIISEPRREVFPEKLLFEMNNEFGEDNRYKRFIEINRNLIGNSTCYEADEITSILKMIGYEIEKKREDLFYNSNYLIIGRKII